MLLVTEHACSKRKSLTVIDVALLTRVVTLIVSLCRTGRSYYRWSLSRGAESGFPQPISNWAGVPFPVDAALQYSVNSRTYFFVRRNYYRIDDSAFAVSITTNLASLTCVRMEESLYLTSAFTVSDA